MSELPQIRVRKGRGAVTNQAGRFEPCTREAVDDGWSTDEALREATRVETQVLPDSSRTILASNDSPDVPFERSINPYRGCEHGCIYCFARPTHAYLGLSAGLDFETKIFAKHDAPALLRKELARRSYKPSTLALGAVTDPYQPVERRLGITRGIIEVLAEARHPFAIVTKSAGVLRDLDLLGPLGKAGLAKVCLSVTSLDRDLARILEPRASTPTRRLEAIRGLAEAGVPVAVLASPMIPAINDMELERILAAARQAGATSASYIMVRLPLEIAPLVEEWLEAHFPERKAKVLSLIRQSRGGKLYDSQWGKRMRGEGAHADALARRFRLAARRLGFDERRWVLDTSQFVRPAADARQMSLL
ncbi:DNA repair photolyase [Tistlia consotensis]|uniref:DNA repair photolyase n=1 Tax=Tistlia consotensis USBA 355 TaxID=560819 RepID=A0A1Y6C677_9PROT|nr:PA0069 family radical SAM protein [Tistlia consotensis]SMF39068.1 DNA repair photolyase [Tistlia consotensis USBA 355]SNR36570.1 DNA repair photolyase [Tistlia consotensis]